MPLYIYACAECEIEVEELRPHAQADWPPVECPLCHGLCRREMSLFSVRRQPASAVDLALAVPDTPKRAHGADCPCCRPRR